MRISKTGIEYRPIDGGTTIIDTLPPLVYRICFHKDIGWWLEERPLLRVGNFKVYGNTNKRIEKIFKTYSMRPDKNLGVLLSGKKGMGKSVFMRRIAEVAIEKQLPVIIVSDPVPGLAMFISKIEQECVILFDEFEKNFLKDGMMKDDEQGSQTQLLSLMDGTDSGKRLFVMAINKLEKVSEFFINRPGRFYYHYKFSYLNTDDAMEYINDNLKNRDEETINKLTSFVRFGKVNYDILSSVVTELNNGYSFTETIEDLNIDVSSGMKYFEISMCVNDVVFSAKKWIRLDSGYEDVTLKPKFITKNKCTTVLNEGSEDDNSLSCDERIEDTEESGELIPPSILRAPSAHNVDRKDDIPGSECRIRIEFNCSNMEYDKSIDSFKIRQGSLYQFYVQRGSNEIGITDIKRMEGKLTTSDLILRQTEYNEENSISNRYMKALIGV